MTRSLHTFDSESLVSIIENHYEIESYDLESDVWSDPSYDLILGPFKDRLKYAE